MNRNEATLVQEPAPDRSAAAAVPWTAPDLNSHALTVEQVLQAQDAQALMGIPAIEARETLTHSGMNALPEAPPRPAWKTYARQFRSPLIYILFAAAVLAVALGHRGDAAVILAVVLANALIGTFQEGRAERSMAALRRRSALRVRVRRDGQERVIEARDPVPGDLTVLAVGDAVAADARLIEAAQLQVAGAALNGESVPVTKGVHPGPAATGLAGTTWSIPGPTSRLALRWPWWWPPACTPKSAASPA